MSDSSWLQVLLAVVTVGIAGIVFKLKIQGTRSKAKSKVIQQTGNQVGGDLAGRDVIKKQ